MAKPGLAADLDAAIDADRLVADICRVIATPSVTGDEAAAQQVVVEVASALGLEATMHDEPLESLRAAADYPGEEVARDRLVNVSIRAVGVDPNAPRLCLNGHIDVVPPGQQPWTTPPFSADVRDGWLRGRGAADMKSALVANLHAVAAVNAVRGRPPGDVAVHSVAGEEDGGLGALAILRHDDDFAGC